MIEHDIIIIGGGPAGASCAWKLRQQGRDVLILDKHTFPRSKLCAGWITSKVMSDLAFSAESYPHSILPLDVKIHLPLLPVGLPVFPTRWDNYSIRRIEFDQWLLDRSAAPTASHTVSKITRIDGRYVIDDKYVCNYLIGAGGTQCPVRKNLFAKSRDKAKQLATLELEFHYPQRKDECHLFFFRRGLRGYSWYVPKGDGVVNVGIGGYSSFFKKPGNNIHKHFQWFLDDLIKHKLMDSETADTVKVTGHPYYLFSFDGQYKEGNCFLVGDAAGLASIDLGEGIGPAIESGLMAADEILGVGCYNKAEISRISFAGPLHWLFNRVIYPEPSQS
jgi:geranylgeranyl reductase family protein